MNENKALTTLAICGAAYLAYTYWKRKKAGKTRPEKVIETYRYEEKTVVVEPEPKPFILSQNQIKALQTKLNAFRRSGALGKLIDPLFAYIEKSKETETKVLAIQDYRLAVSKDLEINGKYDAETRSAVKALKLYINVVHHANLIVDDNYDIETDKLTKWNIFKTN